MLIWSAKQDSIVQGIRFLYPQCGLKSTNDSITCKEASRIQYYNVSTNCIEYGVIEKIDGNSFHVRPFVLGEKHLMHQCQVFRNVRSSTLVRIDVDDYMGHIFLTDMDGLTYVNRYAVLNTLKR